MGAGVAAAVSRCVCPESIDARESRRSASRLSLQGVHIPRRCRCPGVQLDIAAGQRADPDRCCRHARTVSTVKKSFQPNDRLPSSCADRRTPSPSSALLFLCADHFMSEGTLAAAVRRHGAGSRAVVCSGIRVNREAFIARVARAWRCARCAPSRTGVARARPSASVHA